LADVTRVGLETWRWNLVRPADGGGSDAFASPLGIASGSPVVARLASGGVVASWHDAQAWLLGKTSGLSTLEVGGSGFVEVMEIGQRRSAR
jgi:hypothetical protein